MGLYACRPLPVGAATVPNGGGLQLLKTLPRSDLLTI